VSAQPVVRIGLIGAGFLARTRARNYSRTAGAKIVAVASAHVAKAEQFATDWQIAQVEENAEALLARPEIDLVDLCVPNHLHRPLTEAAAAAGKHVVCTKPMVGFPGQSAQQPGDPYPDAAAMIKACQTAGVKLLYGENWVYAPAIRRAASLHAQSEGVILEMRGWEAHKGSHALYAKTWRHSGGGALLRLGAHPIGAMLQLKSEEGLRLHGLATGVVAVTADTADLSRAHGLTAANTHVETEWQDVENWGMASLKFADGTRGIVYGSDNCLGGMQSRLEIYASNAQFQCNLSPHDMLRTYAPIDNTFGSADLMEKIDTQAGWNSAIPDEDWSSGQLAMCEAFVADVAQNRTPLADGLLGAEVMRILHAAYRSAREGRRIDLG
jgi:predicted dehydrogenase